MLVYIENIYISHFYLHTYKILWEKWWPSIKLKKDKKLILRKGATKRKRGDIKKIDVTKKKILLRVTRKLRQNLRRTGRNRQANWFMEWPSQSDSSLLEKGLIVLKYESQKIPTETILQRQFKTFFNTSFISECLVRRSSTTGATSVDYPRSQQIMCNNSSVWFKIKLDPSGKTNTIIKNISCCQS